MTETSDKTTPRFQLPKGQLAEMMLDAAIHVIRGYRQMTPALRFAVDALLDTSSPADNPDEQRDYKVAVVSCNANEFGLRQFVFIAKDGSAFQACGNLLRASAHTLGTLVRLRVGHEEACLTRLGFELPEPMPGTTISARGRAPDAIVQEVWG